MSAITIRDVTDGDGPALARLIAGVFAEYEGCPFVPAEFPELDAVATAFAGRGGAVWVAEADKGIVGCLALAPTHEPDAAELFKLYLDRSWRGQGIAGRLLERAIAAARALGARRLVLWSDTRFVDGHRFYERNGFARRPGLRSLHDAGRSLEFGFSRDL